MRRKLVKLATDRNARTEKIESFKLHAPKEPGQPTMGRQLVARHAVFHVVVLKEERRLSAEVQRLAARPDADERRAKPMRLLVVREVGGKIKRVVEAVRH